MSHEVEKPTYKVVGPLSRFDERDTIFARERLVPGSPLERTYHAMHPELTEIDSRLARLVEQFNEPGESTDQLNAALHQCRFASVASLALPDIVDGPVAPRRVQVAPDVATQRIKALARHLGADEVRIGPLNPAWIYPEKGDSYHFTFTSLLWFREELSKTSTIWAPHRRRYAGKRYL